MNKLGEVEYAGFHYEIYHDETAFLKVQAVPTPGQHPAVNKEKHKKAALEEWLQGQGLEFTKNS